MKKFIFVIFAIVLCLILLPLNAGQAADQSEALVLSTDWQSNSMQIISGDEMDIIVYEIYLNRACTVDNFGPGDFITAESSGSQPQIGDQIISKINLLDWSMENFESFDQSAEIMLDNCFIETVFTVSAQNNMYIVANLGDNTYAAESMEGDEYLINQQPACLNNQIGDLGIILVAEENFGYLTADAPVLFGIKIDLDQLEFKFVPITSCSIGQATPAISTQVDFLEFAENNNIIIDDIERGKILSVKVAPTCKILTNQDYFYGDLIYLSDDDYNYLEPAYLSLFGDLDLDNLTSFADFFQGSTCKILDWAELETYQVEDLLDYYDPDIYAEFYHAPLANISIPADLSYFLSPSGKKIFTQKVEAYNLIGAMIKGESDPATYIVDYDETLRWLMTEEVAARLFGPDWDAQIIWFTDAIIYTYEFGQTIEK